MSGSRLAPQGKALFLDRDGTLIVDKHYLSDPAGVELLPTVRDALLAARAKGYTLFLFSNQSGIGRGYYTLADAEAVNARMEALLALPPPLFADVCLATEAPDQPMVYRKPSPRFILEMIERHGLATHHCWMIGDRETDIEAGLAAGIRVAGLTNGKLTAEAWAQFKLPPFPLHGTLAELVASLP